MSSTIGPGARPQWNGNQRPDVKRSLTPTLSFGVIFICKPWSLSLTGTTRLSTSDSWMSLAHESVCRIAVCLWMWWRAVLRVSRSNTSCHRRCCHLWIFGEIQKLRVLYAAPFGWLDGGPSRRPCAKGAAHGVTCSNAGVTKIVLASCFIDGARGEQHADTDSMARWCAGWRPLAGSAKKKLWNRPATKNHWFSEHIKSNVSNLMAAVFTLIDC